MPSVSEAQRRAMFAAAAGKSTIGIPSSVGKDFAAADAGGKLPARVKAGKSVGDTFAAMHGKTKDTKAKPGAKSGA